MATLLLTHGLPPERFRLLKGYSILSPEAGKAYSQAELLRLLPECDAVVAGGRLDAEAIAACRRVRVIVCYGAGYDAIDLRAATAQAIPVVNIPDTVTEATAELAMALMLDVTRRVSELDRALREGPAEPRFVMGKAMGVSLRNMTLGIVGMGRIGQRVAEFGRFLGMRIVYCGHSIKPFSQAGSARFLPLEDLLRLSDVVTLHCPCTAETAGMLSRERLALMRPTAFLLNTARGRLVDEEALADALSQGRLAGAGLDVFASEPSISPRLLSLPNVVLTPHIGSNTIQTRWNMAEACCEQIEAVMAGHRPEHLLNPEVWGKSR